MSRWPLHKRILLRLARMFRPIMNVTYHGHLLTIDTRDHYIGAELFLAGTWQDGLTNLIPRLNLDGKVAIDVGANIGIFTVKMSDAVGARGRVLAIEPEPYMFAMLTTNTSRLQRSVTTLQTAVGPSVGEASLHVAPKNFGDNRIEPHEACASCIRVQVTTIDALTAAIPDEMVGLVKIDVQGFERQVLAGTQETLRRNPDLILMIELEFDETRKVVSEMWDAGWRGWEVTKETVGPLVNGRPVHELCDVVLARSIAARSTVDAAIGSLTGRAPAENSAA